VNNLKKSLMGSPPISKISLANPLFNEEMKIAAIEALENERWLLGESVFRFEEEFARYCGTKYAISTNSGTTALHLALIALSIKEGCQVITTPASFVATANVVLYVNATPEFADINLGTYTIDPNQVKRKINVKTKVIIPVHLYGYPSDMEAIMEIAEKHEIKVVEDACQAHGAEYKGIKVGALGDVGCFSFYPSKNITVCGDGGMITTNDDEIAEMLKKLRDCGRESKYVHSVIGYTARLNTVNAAIGRIQLRMLNEGNTKRRKNAAIYNQLLSDLNEVITPSLGNNEVRPVFYQYVIRTKNRDNIRDYLEKNNIACGTNYPIPIHLQPIYKKLYGYKGGEYPNSEKLSETCLSIPMYPDLTKDEIHFVSEKIHEYYS